MTAGSSTWSAERWTTWVSDRVETRKRTFVNEPAEMIAAYNREHATMEDYRGREVLELLQNADDAGNGYGTNQALIRYWPEGLCVANTGILFSSAGVQSLMVGNYSPKKISRTKQIGNRGLGFRSVLSWTRCPFVISGNLSLEFSDLLAQQVLRELLDESSHVREYVDEWEREGTDQPIPVLACPATGRKGGSEVDVDLGNTQAMWRRARCLSEEYDTVVALPFTEPGAKQDVLNQIEGLRPELMLFLHFLEKVVVQTEDSERTWSARREGVKLTVVSGSLPSTWRVHQQSGTVPVEMLPPSEQRLSSYEIKIAVPNSAEAPGVLYSFFPTKIRFPYPVVAHVTMQLTEQ